MVKARSKLKSERFAKVTVTRAETKEAEPKTLKEALKETKEAKPDPELERAFEALGKLGGSATSPEICKELGWEPEEGRQKVRSIMDKLHAQHRIHRTKEGKMFHFKVAENAEPKAEPKVEAAA